MWDSALGKLRNGDATRWTNIAAAELRSAEKLQELASMVGDLLPTDEGSFVVFGSMARREFTVDSDLDWTILIDGRADSLHLQLVHQLRKRLDEAKFKVPGPTEVFGGLVFSHDLVHAVGGDEDTNKNMTRRLLLLLESAAVDAPGSHEVRSRIVNAILSRYVQEDASFIGSNTRADRIPRFLLNDVVRFWRTMAVDYANKYRARAGDKWALRNIKLRMSRKLLFVSGFFMCISWALREQVGEDESFVTQNLVDHLKDWTQKTPLESLATVVSQYAPSLAPDIFDNYDAFLALLNNDEKRKGLEKMSPDEAYEDAVFLEARNVAIKFDAALTELLFDSDDSVTQLVKKYGVF
jgi:predicted nucleotidyltransferase